MHTSLKYSLAAEEVRLLLGSNDHTVQRRPMTIIAATRKDEKSILIGADSASTDPGTGFRRTVDNKLQSHPRLQLHGGSLVDGRAAGVPNSNRGGDE